MKKILAILLTVCMVVCMIPAGAFADGTTTVDFNKDVTISLSDNKTYFEDTDLNDGQIQNLSGKVTNGAGTGVQPGI